MDATTKTTAGRYFVKCDECRETMRFTNSVHESACGGRCEKCRAPSVVTKKATAITVGDRVVERDGAFFRVTAIEDAGRSLVFKLANEAGYMLAATQARVSKRANVRVLA